MPVPSDADLVQSAQSGDDKAFETLVEKYRIRIFTTIAAFIDNPQDREDIAQETFINAYRNLHQLSMPERFGSWLDTIAQNQCRDWLRKNRIQTVPIDEVEENLLNSDDSPEHCSVEAEQRRIIAQAIDTLPKTEQQIARAHYLENASHDELVSRHSISYQSVSMRLFRAKRKLAKRLRHLLGGVFLPPATTLKKISSGGLTAMKIGTASKITVGVIAIIVIAFIGSRQLLSPGEDSSPSAEVAASTADKPDQSGSEIDANRKNVVTAPSRADEPQISAKEMEQIEDFFAQLEEADTQSNTNQLTEAEFQQDEEESIPTNTGRFTEVTEQSAEEVMNAFLEAFRILDEDAMRPLFSAEMREHEMQIAPVEFSANVEISAVRIEERDGSEGVQHQDLVAEAEKASRELEQIMLQPFLEVISQAEVVSSGHVGAEFHFRLGMPALEMPKQVPGIDTKIPLPPDMPIPDILIKMRKEDNVWRIYDGESLD